MVLTTAHVDKGRFNKGYVDAEVDNISTSVTETIFTDHVKRRRSNNENGTTIRNTSLPCPALKQAHLGPTEGEMFLKPNAIERSTVGESIGTSMPSLTQVVTATAPPHPTVSIDTLPDDDPTIVDRW